MKNRTVPIFPVLVLLVGLGLRIAEPSFLQEIQLKVFDGFQRLKPRAYQDAPVRIIDLDDETLQKIGQWPWPRTIVAELVKRLADLGASVIVFDIVFAEPDRTSPAQVLPLWPKTPLLEELRSKAGEIPDHDKIFADAISRLNVVTGFSLTPEPHDHLPAQKGMFAFAGDDPTNFLVPLQGAIVNLPELETAAQGNGSFTILAEHDGMIRRVPLVFRLRDKIYPSLAAEALRAAQGVSTYVIKSSGASRETAFGAQTGINHIKIGSFTIPTDSEGKIWLYDTGLVPQRMIPAWKIFEDNFPENVLKGQIVFIGTSAAGLKDIRSTPLNPVAAGVEVHAQLAEQILLKKFLKRPDWSRGAEILSLFVLGLLLTLLMPVLGAAWCAVFGLASLATVFGVSWVAFSSHQLLLDPVFPSLVCLLIYLSASLIHFLKTEAERRHIRGAFSRYMSPALVEQLVQHPDKIRLGGEMKNLSLLFADIRGFTSISEKFTAEELTRFINRFLTPMTDVILKENGTIDKYMGDCIMAFWNAPLDDPEHASHACRSALKMKAYLVEWNKNLRAEYESQGKIFSPIHIGIGINTGDCCVGNMGSEQRFDYSVLGDEVNLASRLEGLTKIYSLDIVVGENTQEKIKSLATLEIDLTRVKGKAKPTRIFTLLGDEILRQDPDFQSLIKNQGEMLRAYRNREWDRALEILDNCLSLDTPQTRLRSLYALYRYRITNFQKYPPPREWDGVADMVLK